MENQHTNIVTAHVSGLGANCQVRQGSAVGGLAAENLVLAAIGHGVGKLHVVVNRFVDLRPCQYGVRFGKLVQYLTASIPYELWRANSG